MAEADPGGPGGAETQLAEVTRIKALASVNSALWSMPTSAKSAGLMAF